MDRMPGWRSSDGVEAMDVGGRSSLTVGVRIALG